MQRADRLLFCEKCNKAVPVNIYQRGRRVHEIVCIICGGYIYRRPRRDIIIETCWNCGRPKNKMVFDRFYSRYGIRVCSSKCVKEYYKKIRG